MQSHHLFHFVFLSQILLISWLLPQRLLGRLRHLVDSYPPSTHPRLYPVPLATVEKTQRLYRNLNLVMLALGLALWTGAIYAPGEEMLGWDTMSVLGLYWFLQLSPLLLVLSPGFTYFNFKRKPDERSTRSAELRPRQLADFVSPQLLVLALLVYIGFVLFIAYIATFDFPWFGGYLNVVGITALNVLFATIIWRRLHAKRSDPYQSEQDRLRQIGFDIKVMVGSSIFMTTFVALTIGLQALGLNEFAPSVQSLFLQLTAGLTFRSFRIESVDFEVYRQDPLAT